MTDINDPESSGEHNPTDGSGAPEHGWIPGGGSDAWGSPSAASSDTPQEPAGPWAPPPPRPDWATGWREPAGGTWHGGPGAPGAAGAPGGAGAPGSPAGASGWGHPDQDPTRADHDPTRHYDNPYAPGGAGGPGANGPAGSGGPAGAGGYPPPPPGYAPYWGQHAGGGGGWGTPAGPGYGAPGGPGGPPSPGSGWHYGWAPARPRRNVPGTVLALLLAVALLVGLGIGHSAWKSVHNGSFSFSPQNPSSGNNNPFGFGNGSGSGFGNGLGNGSGNGSSGLSGVAATAANGLVDIDTSLSYQNGEAAGTGIVLTSDGYILTNNHVISGATSIKATDIANGQTYTATVVGYDRTHDVAVIKLSGASGLKTSTIGDSSKVSVGEAVLGLGNAGGVGGTPSSASGQVTALNQSITAQDESNNTQEKLTGLIQTDANIQPGDSGGALIDSAGRVVGMDTAASTGFSFQTQGNQGFAIPINQAMSIGNDIRAGKASASIHIGATAFLGVEVDTSSAAANTPGAVISQAIAGAPAAQAGLGQGDVIVSLGGSAVDSPASLTNLIGRYHPGDKVAVTWTDPSGQSHTATVTLSTGPAA